MKSKNSVREVFVYADWEQKSNPFLLGMLSEELLNNKAVLSFEYSGNWLSGKAMQSLDPDLKYFQGKQYLPEDKPNFGMFMDSSPDRWGRMLMKRRESILSKTENRKENFLTELDFLTGVSDISRMGGLRFKFKEDGEFVSTDKEIQVPPWSSLKQLEKASYIIEHESSDKAENIKWLNMLIAPGSSLGGARPKASVADDKGHLWIAKFPSRSDEIDSGAWEFITNQLAVKAEINVQPAKLEKFSSKGRTYLSKRFDRRENGSRIHYASAMTLLGYQDGDSFKDNVSYLEIAELISELSSQPKEDLEELWRRIVFNIMVKNTDDHLRNHGFLLERTGWRLSPAFDINPNVYGAGLSLNISENDNSLSTDLALSVTEYFRLTNKKATAIRSEVREAVKCWRKSAKIRDIPSGEINYMERAFLV